MVPMYLSGLCTQVRHRPRIPESSFLTPCLQESLPIFSLSLVLPEEPQSHFLGLSANFTDSKSRSWSLSLEPPSTCSFSRICSYMLLISHPYIPKFLQTAPGCLHSSPLLFCCSYLDSERPHFLRRQSMNDCIASKRSSNTHPRASCQANLPHGCTQNIFHGS